MLSVSSLVRSFLLNRIRIKNVKQPRGPAVNAAKFTRYLLPRMYKFTAHLIGTASVSVFTGATITGTAFPVL
jgi:hypothetical protein